MHVDEVIEKFSSYHPITREDEEAFNIAIDCMKFTRDFLPLNATPERMKKALNLLNSLEYAKIYVENDKVYREFPNDVNNDILEGRGLKPLGDYKLSL